MRHIYYQPADDRDALATAFASAASGFNIDLEDGVLPERKALARANVREMLGARPDISRRAVVRINGISSPLWEEDLAETFEVTDTFLVPMLRGRDELDRLESALAEHERRHAVARLTKKLYLVVETAWLVANLREALAASPRIRGVIVGQADLTVDVGCEGIGDNGGFVPSPTLEWANATIVFAAAERGIPSFIAPWAPAGDRDRRVGEMRRLFALGYQGMVVGSAGGVEDVERAWRPAPAQVEFARGVRDAMAEASERGTGVAIWDGWTVEAPHGEMARRVLERTGESE
jgi:citrate lyase beta subunit